MTPSTPSNKIGLWTTTTLVIGNMIGSGVFLLPAALAAFGGIGLLGWIGSSFGAIVLALMFSNLSKIVPNAHGGPYAFARTGLGDFPGFLVAWGYWIAIWGTNAAISVALVSYLTVFIPALAENSLLAVLAGLSVIWLLTWVNCRGVKEAGKIQFLTTILKVTPLVLVSLAGLFYIDLDNFHPFNISSESTFSAITTTATLTLFAFLGLESATIPAGDIHEPQKTIPRATMIGTIVTMFIYIVGSVVVMGMIPSIELKDSNAPFADAAAIIWGNSARYWVAAGALISTFGALNGWILLQGQMPYSASKDRLFPKIFKRVNSKGAPAFGIAISSLLVSALMMTNFTRGLNETFTFLVLLSTVAALIPFAFAAASYGVLLLQNKLWKRDSVSKVVLALLAFLFTLWAIAGSGEEAVYWGLIAILAGIPFYVWMKRADQE